MVNPYKNILSITDNQRLTRAERENKNNKYKHIQEVFIKCVEDEYSNVNWCLLERFKDNYPSYKEDKKLIEKFLKFIGNYYMPIYDLTKPVNKAYVNYTNK